MIRASESILQAIRAHAARDYPHECCGALLGKLDATGKTVTMLQPIANVHQEGHERRYLIPPESMLRLTRAERKGGPRVLGFYHSHPDHPARPSEYDREWALPWYSYVIVAVRAGEPGDMTCWQLNDDRQAFAVEDIRSEEQDGREATGAHSPSTVHGGQG